MKINNYIKQAYPFYYSNLKEVFLVLCCLTLCTFFFTYLFEPFTVNETEHRINGLWIQIVHAVIPIPISLIYLFLLKKMVKNTEHWTLGKDFFHLGLILFLIGFANFLVRDIIYTNPDNWSLRYFWEEIRNTFLIGILLLIIILPLNLERLIYRHLNFLKQLPYKPSIATKSSVIDIETPILTEQFELNIEAFLFAKVDGNYTEIVINVGGGFEKFIKRMTLKQFEQQLNAFPFVFKVHRSYLVNIGMIESISGNAQGYLLCLKKYSERTIPVSRSKIQEFNHVYSKL